MPDNVGCKKTAAKGKARPPSAFTVQEVDEIIRKTKYDTLKRALEINENATKAMFDKVPDAEQVIAKAREEASKAEEKIKNEVAQSALVPVFNNVLTHDVPITKKEKPKISVIKKKDGVQISRWK